MVFRKIISERSATDWPVPWSQMEGLIRTESDIKVNTAIREFLRALLGVRTAEKLANLKADEQEILLAEYGDVSNDELINVLRLANLRADWLYEHGLHDVTDIVMRAYREGRAPDTEGTG